MHCTSKALLTGAFGPALRRSSALPPPFLVPAFNTTNQTAPFSSTRPQAKKDRNPNRGVSALRRTGFNKRQNISVRPSESVPIPRPVRDPQQRSAIEVDQNHGLWGFFNESRNALMTPSELASHGRGWYVQELRRKDWEDLHRLWWVCIKEMNRLKTFKAERARIGEMYGDYEADERQKEIRRTMKHIRFVLTERWYTWENARSEAMKDESVNLYADPSKGERGYEPEQDAEFEPVEELEAPIEESTATSTFIPPSSSDMGRGGSEVRI